MFKSGPSTWRKKFSIRDAYAFLISEAVTSGSPLDLEKIFIDMIPGEKPLSSVRMMWSRRARFEEYLHVLGYAEKALA
jgi:hypothetical protein